MITTVIPAPVNAVVQSSVQSRLWPVSTNEAEQTMPMRLMGQWGDIKATVKHWGIEVDWLSGQAVTDSHDEYIVDGTLNMRRTNHG